MGHCKRCMLSTYKEMFLCEESGLTSGAEAANGLYSKAVEGSRSSDRTMMELAWTVVGFEELIKKLELFKFS